MANFRKFNRVSAVRTLKHNCRQELLTAEQCEQMGHKRDNIDSSRTAENYDLLQNARPLERYFERLKEIENVTKEKTGKSIRKDAVTLCGWVITAPQDLPATDEKAFFEGCLSFVQNKYGTENIIAATVHKDEKTPHIHIAFMPIVADKKYGGEKLCAKNLETPKTLSKFHTELEKDLSEKFGRSIGILNGATVNGNKTLLELKIDELSRKATEQARAVVDNQLALEVSQTLQTLSKALEQKNFFGKDDKKKQFNAVVQIYEQMLDLSKKVSLLESVYRQDMDKIISITNKTIHDAYTEIFAQKENEQRKIEKAKATLIQEKKALQKKEKELDAKIQQLEFNKKHFEEEVELESADRASRMALKTILASKEYNDSLKSQNEIKSYFERSAELLRNEINEERGQER